MKSMKIPGKYINGSFPKGVKLTSIDRIALESLPRELVWNVKFTPTSYRKSKFFNGVDLAGNQWICFIHNDVKHSWSATTLESGSKFAMPTAYLETGR